MEESIEKGEVPSHSMADDPNSPLQSVALTKTKSKTSAALAKVTSPPTTHSIRDPGPPPDGGATAWTQVFCAWLAVINTWGFVNSFGAFQTYYAEILPQPNSTISWIGSTQACLLFVLGGFTGRALDAGYFRPTIIVGIFIQLVGIFTMSFAKTYWQLLLTQGICTGVGGGIFFIPIMGLVSTYFAKRRGLAIGLVTTGNSIGGVVYPLVVRQLLGKVGFGWTVRVLGFINIVSLAVVIAFMKPRLPPRKSGPLWDMSAFKDVPYMLHILGLCFLMPSVYFVFYYVASFARTELDMPYAQSLNLVMILNGIGFPARILPGYIADAHLGALNTFSICVFLTTITLFCWLAVTSIPAYYAFISFYGLFAAAFQSLFATTVASLSQDNLSMAGTRLGMAFSVIGMSALVSGPISGALLKAGGGYTGVICWAAVSTVVGLGLCVWARGWKAGWHWGTKC